MENKLADIAKRVVNSRKFPSNYKGVHAPGNDNMVLVSAWDLYDLHRVMAEGQHIQTPWVANEFKTNIELVST